MFLTVADRLMSRATQPIHAKLLLCCCCCCRRYLNEAALGGLEGVLAPVNIAATVPQRVFNWWFPANKW
jgi:hypothetical protein